MTKDALTISQEPVVFIRDGAVFADSRVVAEVFDREHRTVLRAIDALIASEPSLALHHFVQGCYANENTGAQRHRYFDMNRDGFSLLVMGFTGQKALRWKMGYIEAFNRMEEELRCRPTDLSDPTALRNLLLGYTEKVIALEATVSQQAKAIEVAAPKTEFYDDFAGADGLYGLQNAARILDQSPNKFIQYLKRDFLFYQGGSLVPRAHYKKMGIFDVKCTMVDDKARFQTFVTPSGMQYFAKVIERWPDLFGHARLAG
ncbi:phage regulatory protein, rha family [Fulvimarina manganoxydans]|uniref:Phage regulatory protein, rha family n=1 Tax=Fulvimarina manganoxydans TaxID=937218 RepID=A0A1W1Y9A4_9HYPH|nr:phage regulatory protein/antirepressor Ant [Fulvimarina manganoxydans]SMC32318.1 phage regulatory protein, rha family [Fulvimarina manganoxydans]